jgi:hypothetical protein
MGLFDKLRNEFINIIDWVDERKDNLVWKFPRYQNEIKMYAFSKANSVPSCRPSKRPRMFKWQYRLLC